MRPSSSLFWHERGLPCPIHALAAVNHQVFLCSADWHVVRVVSVDKGPSRARSGAPRLSALVRGACSVRRAGVCACAARAAVRRDSRTHVKRVAGGCELWRCVTFTPQRV